jgi:hypothetical protein
MDGRTPGRLARATVLALFAAAAIAACDEGSPGQSDQLAFQCVGMDVARCEQFLAEASRQFPGIPVISAVIRCTVPICSDASGEATVAIVFADGQRTEYGTGWAQAGPGVAEPPVPPDEPVPDETEETQPS